MKDFEPLISIIVPCFNHARFLPEALQSLIDQSYKKWECFIVNDGSTDDSEKVAADWSLKDSRIKYYSKKNEGLSSARNAGLNHVNGEYIQFLDADDTISPLKFEKSVFKLSESEKKNAIIISDFLVIDDSSKKMMPAYCELDNIEFTFDTILTDWHDSFTIPIHCAVFPAFYFKEIRFDETLRAKEDWVMWLTVFKKFNPKVLFINEKLAVYRSISGSMSNHTESMYENTHKAYKIIYDQLLDETERLVFFKRVNDSWKREVLSQAREVRLMNNAIYFRVRKKILQLFNIKSNF